MARARRFSLGVYFSGAGLLFVAVVVARMLEIPAASRVLSPWALGGFLIGGVMVNIIQSFAAYLRAFKQEPMLLMSVSTSLLSGCGVLLMAPSVGANGVAWWYCFTMVLGAAWLYRIWETNSKKLTMAQV